MTDIDKVLQVRTRKMLAGHKDRAKLQRVPAPDYTLAELRAYLSTTLYRDLMEIYLKHDMDRLYLPNVMVIDKSKAYTLFNLEVTSILPISYTGNMYVYSAVKCTSIESGEVRYFRDVVEASRGLTITDPRAIKSVCEKDITPDGHGILTLAMSTNGYYFEYVKI